MSKTSKPKKSTKILIETTAGNTILDIGKDHVCSDVNGKLFFKNASDIQEGELLYFRKEHIDKTLDDIESDLRKSNRYNVAYKSLHIDDKPMLSVLLNEGLEAKGITDFSEKVSEIHNLINKDVTEKTVQNWLNGNTVMVDNKSFLVQLSEIAPGLKTWSDAFSIELMIDGELKSVDYDKFKDKIPIEKITDSNGNEIDVRYGSRYTLYDLYKNIRIGIGHYLAKSKNEGGSNKSTSKTTTDKITLGHEIDIVVKQYLNYVTDDIVSAKVLKIIMLDKKDAKTQIKKNDYKLKKGIMKLSSSDLPDFLEKNKLEQITLENTLNDIKGLEYALAKYTYKILDERLNLQVRDIFTAYHVVLPLIKESLSSRSVKHYDVTEINIDSEYEDTTNTLKKELTYDENKIFEILIDVIRVSLDSVPSLYFDVTEGLYDSTLGDKSKVSKRRMHQNQISLGKDYDLLLKSYGYDFTKTTRKMFLGNLELFKKSIAMDVNKKKGVDYPIDVTEQDGIDALQKYGLEKLLPIIFENSSSSLTIYKNE